MKLSCYLCGSTRIKNQPGRVRDNRNLKIFVCSGCGLVFLEKNDDVCEQFYENGGMHGSDPQPVEAWLQDCETDDARRFDYLRKTMVNKRVLDFGCGAGGFLIKAGQCAGQVVGVELDERLYPHFVSKGLTVFKSIEKIPEDVQFDLITAFHVVDHLPDPASILKRMADKLSADGQIVIEIPSSDDALLTVYENTAFSQFTYWSCHKYLFNSKTIALLVEKAGLKLSFIEHIQRYPLSNHLYWLAKGAPGGHEQWDFLNDQALSDAYGAKLAAIGKTDTLIAGIHR